MLNIRLECGAQPIFKIALPAQDAAMNPRRLAINKIEQCFAHEFDRAKIHHAIESSG